ncbi:MAG: ISAs1 family transposase [Comamonadaceae bacterium]|nr:ISAs1 family transposase [Comamonadaceae bacterium]
MAIPLLANCDIGGKDITADALLTQRALASYIVGQQANYHFTVKGNQPTLQRDIALLFENRQSPHFVELTPADHGRIETRRIWCSSALNAYIDFPHVGQVFLIERETLVKKTGELRCETALGITSRSTQEASPQQVLAINRAHWSIESVHHIIDWNYDEDRSRIRTGFGPENITRLRRFADRHPQIVPEALPIHRRTHAQALLPYPPRLRLLAHDEKLRPLALASLRTNLP